MAKGDIGILDTLKWSDKSDSQIVVEARDGIYAVFFEDADTPKCATFRCGHNGVLTKLDEKTLTGITTCAIVFSAIKITEGICAFTYISKTPYPYFGSVSTVAIAADGTITAAVIDTLEFESSSCYASFIAHATGDIFAIVFSNYVTDRSWLVTVDIDSSGNIGAAIEDSAQITTSFSNVINILKIADGIVAIFYHQTGDATSKVETRSIASDGTIGAVIHSSLWADTWEYDLRPFHVSGTIYACSYREGFTSDGWVNTFNIAADGTITSVDIDSQEYETVKVKRWPVGAGGGGVACFFYPDDDSYGQFKTIDIDSSGDIGASVLDTETIDGVYADYCHILKISSVLYLVVWTDNDSYGQVKSVSVVTTEVPTVTTDAATGRGAIAATINGTLDDDGGEACECGFEWGLDAGYGVTTPTETKIKDNTFSQVIGGLFPNTTYHFRAFATNSAGTGHGTDRTFTTALIISRAYALARREL